MGDVYNLPSHVLIIDIYLLSIAGNYESNFTLKKICLVLQPSPYRRMAYRLL